MTTLGQNTSMPCDLEDDAQSKCSHGTWERQYTMPGHLGKTEVRSMLIHAFHNDGLVLKKGSTFRQVLANLSWGPYSSAIAWEFQDRLDDVIDPYIF